MDVHVIGLSLVKRCRAKRRLSRKFERIPQGTILSATYMQKHHLKSVGGVQGALKRLGALDYIAADSGGVWQIVDPIFGRWLERR